MEYEKLARWISQNYQWIFSGIGVLIVTLIVQRVTSRKKSQHESRSTTKVPHSTLEHSPFATGQDITQSVATQTFRAKNIQIGRAVTASVPTAPKHERDLPHFAYAGAKRKNVFVSPWQRDGICDPITEEQRSKSIHALVVKIENKVAPGGKKIASAVIVIAKLKFRHRNGATERDIDYGVWLNSPCNSTAIGIGDTRELVLVCDVDDKFMTFEDKRSGNRAFYSEEFSYFDSNDVADYEQVDITVIDQNTQAILIVKLKFGRDGESIVTSQM